MAKQSKGKIALKRTGRALKSAAKGILASGAEILGAGAMALSNPVSIREKTYRGKPGYLISGKDSKGRSSSIFVDTKKKAEDIRAAIKANDRQRVQDVLLGRVNPSKRIKVKNKYIDLVIKGQAKKTPDGWKVGQKTFAQGRGTTKVSSNYYLDRSTGLVYAKRERNTVKKAKKKAGKRNASRVVHPSRKAKIRRIRVAGAVGRKPVRARSKKNRTAKRATASTVGTRSRVRSRNAKNPSAESIRKEFAGSVSGSRDLFFPKGTPTGLAKLGKLVSITTEEGTIKPVSGTAWLCADTNEKLHIGSTTNAPLFSGPARSFGKVSKVEYESSKPHLGYKGPIIWFHHMGEESGEKPTLYADGKGGLKFRGGRYRLTRRGIEN